ncbi:MAG: pyridoxamine 5'-phosphate oxidase family protein [Paludibacteraceae bacterium]
MRTSFITNSEEIDKIIESCDVCFVGMLEEDGSPYVIPMSFALYEGDILLHSGPHGKHLSLIEKDNRVCITFCSGSRLMLQHPDVACSYSMQGKSVLCKGKIEFIEDFDEKERLVHIFMSHYVTREFKFSAPAIRNVKVWRLRVESKTAKSFGQNFKSQHTQDEKE